MDTYIAIKKNLPGLSRTKPRRGRGSTGLASVDTAEKRAFLSAEAQQLEESQLKLLDTGLNEFSIQETLSGNGIEALGGSFSRLAHVGAYILQVSAPDELQQAQATLGEEYSLIPDIALSLPATLSSGVMGANARGANWPVDSNIAAAHADGFKGEDVIVAVLDTGCDADHVQFANKSLDFRYFPPTSPETPRTLRGFDPHGHGTHVCGIIAGNSIGVAPEATLMVASVIESEKTSTSLRRILAALEWVMARASEPGNREKAVIVNMSLGFRPNDVSNSSEKVFINAVRDVLRRLVELCDILPVVAVGNEGPGQYRYPAAFPEALAVGAVDSSNTLAEFSGGGQANIDGVSLVRPDVVGYGVDIYSAFERNIAGHSRYQRKSGTSMATPYVAGIAALVAQSQGLRGDKLRRKLIESASPLVAYPADRVGAGLVCFK